MHIINNEPSYKRKMYFLSFIIKPFILNFNKLVHSIVIYNWVFVQFVSLCNVANRPFKRTVYSYLHRKYHIVRTQNHLMLVLLYTLYKDKLLLQIALFNFKCKWKCEQYLISNILIYIQVRLENQEAITFKRNIIFSII